MDETYPVLAITDNGDYAPVNVRIVLPGTPDHDRESAALNKIGPSAKPPEPFVEIYDMRTAQTVYGQRICSYRLSTFVESPRGLNLSLGVDAWSLTPDAHRQAAKWATSFDAV